MPQVGYVKLQSYTASFRLPQAISGMQLALEVPPYSAILGMLASASGREITPEDTRIGIHYSYEGSGTDLETIHRWGRKPTGRYTYNGTTPRKRQVHYNATLEIIFDNLELVDELEAAKHPITLGRSQDIATLAALETVEAKPVEKGTPIGSLIPAKHLINKTFGGFYYNLPEYFDYLDGYVRRPLKVQQFVATTDFPEPVKIPHLFTINETTFYLHNWA